MIEAIPPDVSIGLTASAAPAETALSPDRVAKFRRTLADLTPWVYVTPIIVGVNLLLFVLMTASGVSPTKPDITDLLGWGGNFGPKTIGGEWWRLLTCTFVHFGIIHMILNMLFLVIAGRLVERMLGNVGFLIMYLFAGLAGSVASLFWNPNEAVAAGASGAVFGIYGALLALLLRRHGSIPPEALTGMQKVALGLLCLDLILEFFIPVNRQEGSDGSTIIIDIAAHLGGMTMGLFTGFVLSQPFTREALAGRRARHVAVTGLGAVFIIGSMIALSVWHADVVQAHTELDRFEVVERKLLDGYNAALEKFQRGDLTDAEFADRLEREVLPEWRAAHERLCALKHLPQGYQRTVALLLDYVRLRQEHWELLVQALRQYAEAVQAQKDVEHFLEVERKAMVAFNAALEKSQRQELTDAAFADLIERQLLPEWHVVRERVSAIQHVPEAGQRHFASVLECMRLRHEAWELVAQALREPSEQKWQQANNKQDSANQAAQRSSESWQGLVQSMSDASAKMTRQATEKEKLVEQALKRLEENVGTQKRR